MTEHVPTFLQTHGGSGTTALNQVVIAQPMLHQPRVMRPSISFFLKNAMLARMPIQDLAVIGGFLEPVALKKRMVLQEPRRQLDHVYFIESGLVSLRIVAPGSVLETAVIGHKGAIGVSLLLGGHVSSHQSVVLIPGTAYRIRIKELRSIMNQHPQIQTQLYQHAQALSLHCAHAGLCGVRHEREQRLASWLCLASDALDAHVLPVTHDYLSSALGLRRPGVTETLLRFERHGLIRKMRGVLQIDDRKCLEQKTCSCYKIISGAYGASECATAG